MTVPLIVLAAATVLLSLFATPFWPWLEGYLYGHAAHLTGLNPSTWLVLGLSTLASATGIALGTWVYRSVTSAKAPVLDPLERHFPRAFRVLQHKFFVDELYAATVVRGAVTLSRLLAGTDQALGAALKDAAALLAAGGGWLSRTFDEWVINASFDDGCHSVRGSGGLLSRLHNGKGQHYLRALAVGVVVLVLGLIWIGRK